MDIVTYALCKKMASGSKGEKGDPGEKGEQGLPGRDGADGVTPNLQVGDVVTLEAGQQASITRRGNDENPIFDFAIPKGDTGKDGIFVGRVEDAPDHAQVVVNDDASPYDLFFEDANVSYMGDTYTSLKEKSDADIEYLLREIQTQHYEGQRITATNTYQKQVKSAILKGSTLLNLATPVEYKTINFHGYCLIIDGSKLKSGTYTTKSSVDFSQYVLDLMSTQKDKPHYYARIQITKDGVFTIDDTFFIANGGKAEDFFFCLRPVNDVIGGVVNTNEIENVRLVLLEGDYANIDIPFFTGMQSVKMPVLTTTGENLFYNTLEYGDFNNSTGIPNNTSSSIIRTKEYNEISSNGTYRITVFNETATSTAFYVHEYDNDFNYIKSTNSNIFTTSANTKYVKFRFRKSDSATYTEEELSALSCMITKENTIPTTYKPYKSNILSTSEDVVLRGIGEVRDTLDCLTGEVVQNIGEMVLDGSENWVKPVSQPEITSKFMLLDFPNNPTAKILSNFKVKNSALADSMGIWCDTNTVLNVDKSIDTVEQLKAFLFANNITIQITKKQESIKTVDLNNQKVYSYDGTTHYTTSSGVEGHLAPILSIDVPTNLPALVSRQRDTIKDLEKENEALKEEVVVVNQQRESGDLELLSSDFDLDFRLMEIEFALDIPIAATFKEVRNMARTPYEMAKILILGGKYERSDMEYKLGKYLERKQITQAQYDELIALMEANELVV